MTNYFEATDEKINDLQSRFGTETTPVTVNGKTIQIVQAKEIGRMIEKQFSQDDPLADFPFWAKIWEASIILSHEIAKIKPEDDKRFLEIGAGIGVAGLFAAAFGHEVTITDYNEDAMLFAMMSAQANQLHNVRFQLLDWCSPSLYGKYDYIIGSEVLFNTKFSVPLCKLLNEALAPDGAIYLAHDKSRMAPRSFFELADHHFKIETKNTVMRGDDEEFHIVVHRLRRKV